MTTMCVGMRVEAALVRPRVHLVIQRGVGRRETRKAVRRELDREREARVGYELTLMQLCLPVGRGRGRVIARPLAEADLDVQRPRVPTLHHIDAAAYPV